MWDLFKMFLGFALSLKLLLTPQNLMVEAEYERVARVCNNMFS